MLIQPTVRATTIEAEAIVQQGYTWDIEGRMARKTDVR